MVTLILHMKVEKSRALFATGDSDQAVVAKTPVP